MLGMINEAKLGFLKEILDAINRQDLCEMINAFEDGGRLYGYTSVLCRYPTTISISFIYFQTCFNRNGRSS